MRRAGADDAGGGESDEAAGVRTIVSLNPVMVDGTGMCGGCRSGLETERCTPAWTARNSTGTWWISTC